MNEQPSKPLSPVEINQNLRTALKRFFAEDESGWKRATAHLDTLPIEEQNSQLNIATTYLADVRTRGL